MPSNVENILNAILTGDGSGIQKPASRVEELLFEIYEQGGGGGGESVIGGIKLTIDENYVMTATLVDKDGEEYGVSDDIDLPLEEMVVDAEYDPQTQKIKLELKNGNYVEFSVAELVSGLQTELSSSNKLNPAYIAYDEYHRAVSDTEKGTWNAKQNAISDLETIRSGAAAGATAVQPATMSEALAAKQNSLSRTQLASVNSGITSEKVTQISTNQTNILYALNTGVKNIAFLKNGTYQSASGGSETTFVVENGVVTVTSTTADTRATVMNYVTLEAGTYIITNRQEDGRDVRLRYNGVDYNDTFTIISATTFEVRAYSYKVLTNATITPLLCVKSVYDQDSSYQPPALPNYDLTRLESEDRAGLIDVVDGGAKNLLDTPTVTVSDITFTADSDHYITASPNNGDGRLYTYANCQYKLHLKKGTYILALEIKTSTSSNNANVLVTNTSNTEVATIPNWEVQNKTGLVYREFTISTEADYGVLMKCYTMAARLMICTKAAFCVSQKFVPYAKSNYSLTGLTSGLLATSYQTVSPIGNYISDIEGGYVKIGNLIVINIRCTVDNATPATWTTLLSGLPYPIVQYRQGSSGSPLSNNKGADMAITGAGIIASATAIATGTLLISGVYMSK